MQILQDLKSNARDVSAIMIANYKNARGAMSATSRLGRRAISSPAAQCQICHNTYSMTLAKPSVIEGFYNTAIKLNFYQSIAYNTIRHEYD